LHERIGKKFLFVKQSVKLSTSGMDVEAAVLFQYKKAMYLSAISARLQLFNKNN
jgi:hypothetical protein